MNAPILTSRLVEEWPSIIKIPNNPSFVYGRN